MLLVAFACSSSASERSHGLPPLGHTGRWMTDPAGRVVVIHGVNMVAKRPPYVPTTLGFGEDDARFLADHGFRAVRLGVIWKAVEPTPGRYDDRYLRRIERIVTLLAGHGIYSLLDFHQDALNERFGGEGFPDWAVERAGKPDGPDHPGPGTEQALLRALDRFWTGARGPGGVTLQQRYASFAAHVAHFFRQHDDVLGYDLINEPFPGTKSPACRKEVDCSSFDRDLGAFERRVTRAIRREDGRHLVWYEPNTLFNWARATRLPPIHDRRAGLSFHAYCRPPSFGGGPCKPLIAQILANAEARTAQTGDALMATEFGHTDPTILTAFTDLADQHRMSWMAWAYCGCGAPTYPFPVTAHVDDLVIDPMKPPRAANVVHGKLDALVRPYPEAVSGTPTTFGFDPATKTFALSYTTDRVDGRGRFKSGACTKVFIPRLQYPYGYQVVTRGAEVVSAAGAGTLALRSRPGSTRVTVRIAPARHSHTDRPARTDGCSTGDRTR